MSSALSPPLTGLSKNGVSTMPGSISVTLIWRRRDLLAQRLAHRRHRVLGGRVERARQRAPSGDRARDQEVAGVLLLEVGEGRPDRVGDAEHVREDHRAPLLGRLLEEPALRAEAGVREDRVEPRRSARGSRRRSASWSDHSVTSQRCARAWSSPSSSASSSSLSSERAPSATRQPRATACRAVSAPMPGARAGDQQYAFVGHSRRIVPIGCARCCAHTARFPEVPAGKGHYESFYLKACHPSEPLGIWIRYTVHKHSRQEPQGSLWFTLFDGNADGPLASKVTTPDVSAPEGAYIRIGDSAFEDGRAAGTREDRAARRALGADVRLRAGALFHLPRDWMYRAPVPQDEAAEPVPGRALRRRSPRGRARGRARRAGAAWSATTGAPSTPSAGSGSTAPASRARTDAWLDAAIGRIKLGLVDDAVDRERDALHRTASAIGSAARRRRAARG